MLQIKHIAFDLDGSLIETKDIHFKSLNSALLRYGYTPITESEHKKYYDGLPTAMKLEMLGIPSEKRDLIKREKQAITEELIFHSSFYNFTPLMTQLRESGFKIAVFSNAVRRGVNIMLAACCPAFEFDYVLSNEDISLPKPDPEGYQKIASYFEIYPQDMIVIEDNKFGLDAALNAGCLTYKTRHVEDTKDILSYILTSREQKLS